MRPKAQRTTVTRAMAGAVPSRSTQLVGRVFRTSGVGPGSLPVARVVVGAAAFDRPRRRALARRREGGAATGVCRTSGRVSGPEAVPGDRRSIGRRGRVTTPVGREGWRSRVAVRGAVVRSATELSSTRQNDDGTQQGGGVDAGAKAVPTHAPSLLHLGVEVVEAHGVVTPDSDDPLSVQAHRAFPPPTIRPCPPTIRPCPPTIRPCPPRGNLRRRCRGRGRRTARPESRTGR